MDRLTERDTAENGRKCIWLANRVCVYADSERDKKAFAMAERIARLEDLLDRMTDDVALTIIECCKNEMAYQQRIMLTREDPFWKDKHERNIKACERTIDILELILDIRNNT